MDSAIYSYKDRQMHDLAEHRRGCGIFTLFFVVFAFIAFLCSLIDNHPEIGLVIAGFILLIGGVIIGFSYKEYLRKVKDMEK